MPPEIRTCRRMSATLSWTSDSESAKTATYLSVTFLSSISLAARVIRPFCVATTAEAWRPVLTASRVTSWTSRLVAPPSGVESVIRNAPARREDMTMISVPMRSANRRTAALRSLRIRNWSGVPSFRRGILPRG
jgi:hypothetical protein